jgi:hypothetical protein
MSAARVVAESPDGLPRGVLSTLDRRSVLRYRSDLGVGSHDFRLEIADNPHIHYGEEICARARIRRPGGPYRRRRLSAGPRYSFTPILGAKDGVTPCTGGGPGTRPDPLWYESSRTRSLLSEITLTPPRGPDRLSPLDDQGDLTFDIGFAPTAVGPHAARERQPIAQSR